jgi:hypothetical protein
MSSQSNADLTNTLSEISFFLFLCFETRSHCVVQAASASRVLGSQVCATIPGQVSLSNESEDHTLILFSHFPS